MSGENWPAKVCPGSGEQKLDGRRRWVYVTCTRCGALLFALRGAVPLHRPGGVRE